MGDLRLAQIEVSQVGRGRLGVLHDASVRHTRILQV